MLVGGLNFRRARRVCSLPYQECWTPVDRVQGGSTSRFPNIPQIEHQCAAKGGARYFQRSLKEDSLGDDTDGDSDEELLGSSCCPTVATIRGRQPTRLEVPLMSCLKSPLTACIVPAVERRRVAFDDHVSYLDPSESVSDRLRGCAFRSCNGKRSRWKLHDGPGRPKADNAKVVPHFNRVQKIAVASAFAVRRARSLADSVGACGLRWPIIWVPGSAFIFRQISTATGKYNRPAADLANTWWGDAPGMDLSRLSNYSPADRYDERSAGVSVYGSTNNFAW